MEVFWHTQLGALLDRQISLSKPAGVLAAVLDLGYERRDAAAATPLDLFGTHAPGYVFGVLTGHEKNGFGNTDPEVNLHALAACGVHAAAAARALETPGVPVLAPVGGFHHAHYDNAYGFCTFNGLLATVLKLRETRELERVLIIDGDGHTGDGTQDILDRAPRLFNGVHNLTNMSRTNWIRELKSALGARWDLILYQAGADAHVDDPYGAGYLDYSDWQARDEFIFFEAARSGTPIVWNLAGGYNGQTTIDLHVSTARSARLGANIRRRLDATAAAILKSAEETPAEGPVANDVGDQGGPAEG